MKCKSLAKATGAKAYCMLERGCGCGCMQGAGRYHSGVWQKNVEQILSLPVHLECNYHWGAGIACWKRAQTQD